MHLTDLAEGPEAALAIYRRVLVSGPPRPRPWDPSPIETFLHANLAWFALKTDDPAELGVAETFAPLAFASAPYTPVIRATQGALYVRRGAVDEGEALLLDGLKDTDDAHDRADFCAILARARRASSDPTAADDFEALGRHILAAQ